MFVDKNRIIYESFQFSDSDIAISSDINIMWLKVLISSNRGLRNFH